MSGSNRGKRHSLVEWVIPVLGIVLAISISWGLGRVSVQSEQAEEQGYQHYRYAPDDEQAARAALSEPTKPIEYRTPCTNPKGHDESDLCAQWQAAKAANLSAIWTKVAGISAAFGVIGLIITLGFNLKAWEAAREANQISRDSERPWLTFDISIKEVKIDDMIHSFVFDLSITNVGKSPAVQIEAKSEFFSSFPKGREPNEWVEIQPSDYESNGGIGFMVLPDEKHPWEIDAHWEANGPLRQTMTRLLVISLCYRSSYGGDRIMQTAKGIHIHYTRVNPALLQHFMASPMPDTFDIKPANNVNIAT